MIIRYIVNFIKWAVTILAGLAGANAAFFYVIWADGSHLPYHRAGNQAVCLILKSSEALKFVTPKQRDEWSKVATPGEEVTNGNEYAPYYRSDCTMTSLEFESRREKR